MCMWRRRPPIRDGQADKRTAEIACESNATPRTDDVMACYVRRPAGFISTVNFFAAITTKIIIPWMDLIVALLSKRHRVADVSLARTGRFASLVVASGTRGLATLVVCIHAGVFCLFAGSRFSSFSHFISGSALSQFVGSLIMMLNSMVQALFVPCAALCDIALTDRDSIK
jgi:hypothetical protein